MIKCLITFVLLLHFSFIPAENPKAIHWTEEMLRSMSLNEKIGQLFMIAAYSNKDEKYETELENLIREYDIGGIIFFQGDPVQQVVLTNRYQKTAKYPLFIGMDAEHGIGWRLKTALEFPRMLIDGAVTDDSLIYELGARIARHCKEIGVHINFAPVADVNNNPRNPVIGMRSFGEDPENVYRKTAMYIRGSLSEAILPVVKHFPGHGDTDTDSHQALPLIPYPAGRLDSVELYPFKKLIADRLPAIMAGHLDVPALDSTHRPASLSPLILKKYLRDSLKFEGLCFTDAMNMKGVTRGLPPGEAEVRALLAGNDVLLFPANIAQAVARIKKAIADSIITEQEIDEKCRKILLAKYKFVLPNIHPISTEGLWSRLNTPADFALKQNLYKNAITLIRNTDNLLPLKDLDTLHIASLNFGGKAVNTFQTNLKKYADVQNLISDGNFNEEQLEALLKKLEKFNCIILYNSKASDRSSRNFGYTEKLEKLIGRLKNKRIILCHPAIPYGLKPYTDLPVDAILVTYEDHLYARQYAAQALFGGIPVRGRLPVSVSPLYPAGTGINTPKIRLGYAPPEIPGLSTPVLEKIDSVCQAAIEMKATPGCQVLIAKNGYIVYNKAFGFHTYQQKTPNRTSDIYDLASVTKITATLPAVMKLFEEQKIQMDTSLAVYLPVLQETDKKAITLREVLSHTAGLKASIPVFLDAVDKKLLPCRLFTSIPTKYNSLKLKKRLYVNPNFHFRDSTFSRTARKDYEFLEPGIFIYPSYRDSIRYSILHSPLKPTKDYLYSDLGFILLQQTVENVAGEPLDQYCRSHFYRKIGAFHTDFNAAKRLNTKDIVPASVDKLYRKREVKGYVHDPLAAVFHGVAGHAGLFSTAEDLAKILSVYLNEGTYGGIRFFQPSTISLFTRKADDSPKNRRGLGFDKPEPDSTKVSPTCPEASLSSYGHTGFTGTMVWCDPQDQLIYIFLSNRTYPNEFNTKLNEENIRTKIQHIIYQAIQKQGHSIGLTNHTSH